MLLYKVPGMVGDVSISPGGEVSYVEKAKVEVNCPDYKLDREWAKFACSLVYYSLTHFGTEMALVASDAFFAPLAGDNTQVQVYNSVIIRS